MGVSHPMLSLYYLRGELIDLSFLLKLKGCWLAGALSTPFQALIKKASVSI